MRSQANFNRVPEKVPEKVWEGLVQSQVGFNRVPEKVPEKVPGSLVPWCKAKSGSTGSREGPGKGFGKFWWWASSGSTGSTGCPALGFAARFRKICKNKMLRLLGIPPKLIHSYVSYHRVSP